MTMGPSTATDMLRKGLALGANSAVHVLDDGLVGADIAWTSIVLAVALQKTGFDLVIAGNESTDGRGGIVPAMLAERLGVPNVTFANSLRISDGSVSGVRESENGTVAVSAALPAISSITESSPDARFPNFKGIMRAKKKPLDVWSLDDLGIGPDALAHVGRSVVLSAVKRPERSAGTKIVDDGTAADQLAEFLAANRLI